MLRGFSFTEKKWLTFVVDHISDVLWKEDSLSRSSLPPYRKEVLEAFVSEHIIGGSELMTLFRGKAKAASHFFIGHPAWKRLSSQSTWRVCKMRAEAIRYFS